MREDNGGVCSGRAAKPRLPCPVWRRRQRTSTTTRRRPVVLFTVASIRRRHALGQIDSMPHRHKIVPHSFTCLRSLPPVLVESEVASHIGTHRRSPEEGSGPMIYTVTLNPALDKTATVENLRLDSVNRIRHIRRLNPGSSRSRAKGFAAFRSRAERRKLLSRAIFTNRRRKPERRNTATILRARKGSATSENGRRMAGPPVTRLTKSRKSSSSSLFITERKVRRRRDIPSGGLSIISS